MGELTRPGDAMGSTRRRSRFAAPSCPCRATNSRTCCNSRLSPFAPSAIIVRFFRSYRTPPLTTRARIARPLSSVSISIVIFMGFSKNGGNASNGVTVGGHPCNNGRNTPNVDRMSNVE